MGLEENFNGMRPCPLETISSYSVLSILPQDMFFIMTGHTSKALIYSQKIYEDNHTVSGIPTLRTPSI